MPRIADCRACGRAFAVQGTRGRIPTTCSQRCRRAIAPVYVPRATAKVCVECGAFFETPNRKTVCCSPACGNIRGKRLGDATRKSNAIKRRTRLCEHCGDQFVEGSRSGAQHRNGQRQRFCSVACASLARRTPEVAAE